MAWLTVTRTYTEDSYTETDVCEWPRHTAADACQARYARLQDARRRVLREGETVLIVEYLDHQVPHVERLEFTDPAMGGARQGGQTASGQAGLEILTPDMVDATQPALPRHRQLELELPLAQETA